MYHNKTIKENCVVIQMDMVNASDRTLYVFINKKNFQPT